MMEELELSRPTRKAHDERQAVSDILDDYSVYFSKADRSMEYISEARLAETPAEARTISLLAASLSMLSSEVALVLESSEDGYIIETLVTREWKTEFRRLRKGKRFP